MRAYIYFSAIFIFLPFSLFGQIKLDSERDKDGNVLIFATNSAAIPYTVILNFSTLQNLTTSGGSLVTGIARPGRNQLAKLRPTLSGQSTNYNYSYSFGKGDVYGKNKKDPIFIVPVSEGQKVIAMQMVHIENRLGPDRSNDSYVGVLFKLDSSSNIIAPRKGVIAEVKMAGGVMEENLDYNRSENHIEIYHEDGTITRLMVLRPGSEKVKVGDLVLPGDVLAESAGENYATGSHVRMVNLKTEKDGDKLKYTVIPVKFSTDNGAIEISDRLELDVIHPQEVIEMEMSKREIKKYSDKK